MARLLLCRPGCALPDHVQKIHPLVLNRAVPTLTSGVRWSEGVPDDPEFPLIVDYAADQMIDLVAPTGVHLNSKATVEGHIMQQVENRGHQVVAVAGPGLACSDAISAAAPCVATNIGLIGEALSSERVCLDYLHQSSSG